MKMNDNYTIYDVMRQLSAKRKMWVKHRFDLYHPREKKPQNEAELIAKMKLASGDLSYFKSWEQSEEFKHITALVLQSKQAADLEAMYNKAKQRVMSDNATTKDIEMMVKMQTIIEQAHKQAQDYFTYVFEDYEGDE